MWQNILSTVAEYIDYPAITRKLHIIIKQDLYKLCTFIKNTTMNLFIAGLPFDVDDQELKELFEEYEPNIEKYSTWAGRVEEMDLGII